MNKQSREALDAYYVEADSWAHDRQDALRSSRRIAWIVAIVAAAIALFEALALLLLVPLKTVVPYTLMVDRETGFVQELKPVDAQLVSSRTALTQSFLVQYVIAREGYDYDALQNDYRKVALWSSGSAQQSYLSSMQASNPASPLARYPRSSIVDVQVKSVTSLGKDTAMVRFQTQRHDAGGHDYPPQQWVSVIRYGWSGAPMSIADRYINPLGFTVSRYNRSAETLPVAQDTTPVASPADAVASDNTAVQP
jgi:type IV secretion system protein VirB8